MTHELTNEEAAGEEAAGNLAKRFMRESPEFRRTFIETRLWSYQLMRSDGIARLRCLDAYGAAREIIDPDHEEPRVKAAFLAEIEAHEAAERDREQIAKLDRRIENLEKGYADVLKRLDRLEDSWVRPDSP